MIHQLQVSAEYFGPYVQGLQKLLPAGRSANIQEGDFVRLAEVDGDAPTGDTVYLEVVYVAGEVPGYPDVVVLGVSLADRATALAGVAA